MPVPTGDVDTADLEGIEAIEAMEAFQGIEDIDAIEAIRLEAHLEAAQDQAEYEEVAHAVAVDSDSADA